PTATILAPPAAYSRPLATAIGCNPGSGVVQRVSSVLGASATAPSLLDAKITLLLALNLPQLSHLPVASRREARSSSFCRDLLPGARRARHRRSHCGGFTCP